MIEERETIEIISVEKREKPLEPQLIEELYIEGIIKPENQYQML